MKLPFKFARVSTIVHATEDEDKIKGFLREFFPDDVEIESSEAEGHYGDPKSILSAEVRKRPLLRKFWDEFLDRLSESGRARLLGEAIERIADDCYLYMRFDKQFAISEGELRFSDGGDVFHFRLNVAAYPAKREIAVEKMKEFIDSGLDYK